MKSGFWGISEICETLALLWYTHSLKHEFNSWWYVMAIGGRWWVFSTYVFTDGTNGSCYRPKRMEEPGWSFLPSMKLTFRSHMKIGRIPKGISSSKHPFSGVVLVSRRVQSMTTPIVFGFSGCRGTPNFSLDQGILLKPAKKEGSDFTEEFPKNSFHPVSVRVQTFCGCLDSKRFRLFRISPPPNSCKKNTLPEPNSRSPWKFKMDAWKTFSFLFWDSTYFQLRLPLVPGSL